MFGSFCPNFLHLFHLFSTYFLFLNFLLCCCIFSCIIFSHLPELQHNVVRPRWLWRPSCLDLRRRYTVVLFPIPCNSIRVVYLPIIPWSPVFESYNTQLFTHYVSVLLIWLYQTVQISSKKFSFILTLNQYRSHWIFHYINDTNRTWTFRAKALRRTFQRSSVSIVQLVKNPMVLSAFNCTTDQCSFEILS